MTPDWALTLIYWVHMLATVTWLGGLGFLVFLVLPLAQRTQPPGEFAAYLETIQRRLDPIIWLCVLLLLATGLFQMSANPNYDGMLAISNRWAAAILIKHLVFIGMIGVNALMSWSVLPGLKRVALMRLKGVDAPEAQKLRKQEIFLLRLNLGLGILVLGLTALARIS